MALWKPSLPEQFSAADKREQHVEELLVFVGPQQLYQERVTDLLNISHYKMLSFKKLPTDRIFFSFFTWSTCFSFMMS